MSDPGDAGTGGSLVHARGADADASSVNVLGARGAAAVRELDRDAARPLTVQPQPTDSSRFALMGDDLSAWPEYQRLVDLERLIGCR